MTTMLGNPGTCGCGAGYCCGIEVLRQGEYPYLKGSVYLDHAGTTLYAASLVRAISDSMIASLYGNPHSLSSSSERSTSLINDVRLRTLAFFNADPGEYDLVFVANATSAINLVAESLRNLRPSGFHYGYHVDSHTSLVGLRELAGVGYRCLGDGDVDGWISEHCTMPTHPPALFAFPAQSNLNGRRPPVHWCKMVRVAAGKERRNSFSLLDAASFVSTAPLNVNEIAPDFVALSFSTIFGFPHLGALIVRKDACYALGERKFLGGGAVDMVIASEDEWHATKQTSIHERFEDGTLPLHKIIAWGAALTTHERLYGSMANISLHTGWLAKDIYDGLSNLRHFNGARLCHMYRAEYGNSQVQGPIIAFNLHNSRGDWIPNTQVETLAAARNIHLRSESVCSPEGTLSSLGWTNIDLRQHFVAALRCDVDLSVLEGRLTGILRISLGAMTSHEDVQSLIHFIRDTYADQAPEMYHLAAPRLSSTSPTSPLFVETVTVFPILGCGGFKISADERWEIHEAGLAWDHVWCLVHETTNKILQSQEHPQMRRISASVRLEPGVLRLSCPKRTRQNQFNLEIPLPVTKPRCLTTWVLESAKSRQYQLTLQEYDATPIKTFFFKTLGVPCTLAMIPSQYAGQPSYHFRPFRPAGVDDGIL